MVDPQPSTEELATLVLRHLVRRGHEVPEDVRAALPELAGQLSAPTVRAAHEFSIGLTRRTGSRTLAAADLTGLTAQLSAAIGERSGGLTAVG